MYFYPKHISQDAVEALQAAGLELNGGEMVIPDDDCKVVGDGEVILRGVHLSKRVLTFSGHMDPPKVWSSLEGDMVYTGRDMNQCSICGYWLSDKPSPENEKQHLQQHHTRYEWVLACSSRK